MRRQASAKWEGNLKNGKGAITTDSGALARTPYSFGTRFENELGANPEELLAAAHAACFSMALAAELGASGVKPESIYTTASVELAEQSHGFAIIHVHLDVTARLPGVDRLAFERAVNAAKEAWPISQLVKKFTMSVNLLAM